MALSTGAKVALFATVLAGVGLAGGFAVRAAKRLREQRRDKLPAGRQWTSEGEYVSNGVLVSWRTYLLPETGEHGAVYEVGDLDSADLCCFDSGQAALGAVLDAWPSDPEVDQEALAREFERWWSADYRALDEGRVAAVDSLYDEDVHWVLVRDPSPSRYATEYRVLYTVGGILTGYGDPYPSTEQAMWAATDAITGPPWLQTCPGADAYVTEHPHVGELWYCPSAGSGSTAARGWVVEGVQGRSAEWRVQKTANPDAPYVAQYRPGLDPLDGGATPWTFIDATDFNTDAVAWAYAAAKEAA